MSAIDKTLHRVNERIKNQEFYEAHQAVRTVVARYERTKDHPSAIGLLYSSALLLAHAQQTGSASDLVLYMIKIYVLAGVKPDGSSRGRIAEIVYHLDPLDPVLKQLAQKAIHWAPHDSELAHTFGSVFLQGRDIKEAERYLLQGTKDSAVRLARAHQELNHSQSNLGIQSLTYSRGVLGYLSANNLRNAIAYWQCVTESFAEQNPVTEFLDLLIKTCQTKDAALYHQLEANYRPKELAPAWAPALQRIEEAFFQIVPAKPFNLMNMMGGLMN